MLMQPAPSSETSSLPSLRVFIFLTCCMISLGSLPDAAHENGPAARPAPTREARVKKWRRSWPLAPQNRSFIDASFLCQRW